MTDNTKTDEELMNYISENNIKIYDLEKHVENFEKCVEIRRKILSEKNLNISPEFCFKNYDYSRIYKKCCENVIGYVRIPVGIVGPILLNGQQHYVPFATTEGCLVASTMRGSSCVRSHGISGQIIDDGMTRAPILKTDSILTAVKLKNWINEEINFLQIKKAFNSTSKFADLLNINITLNGRYVYLRFKATTGEAMGMNMVSKGVEAGLDAILFGFGHNITVISLSGNYCCDKKPSAVNWIEGRGKSVVCEAFIPNDIILNRLNVTSKSLVDMNINKNFVGSALAGSIGGNNANSANVIAAIFTATGQDIAQVVESSNCMTFMEMENESLYVSCTMPCLEVATIGGGTCLSDQKSCIDMMNLSCNDNSPSANFALLCCATVLCSELSLLAALCSGTLVSSHMKFNRCSQS